MLDFEIEVSDRIVLAVAAFFASLSIIAVETVSSCAVNYLIQSEMLTNTGMSLVLELFNGFYETLLRNVDS